MDRPEIVKNSHVHDFSGTASGWRLVLVLSNLGGPAVAAEGFRMTIRITK